MVSYIKTNTAVNIHANGETLVVQTSDLKFAKVMEALKLAQSDPSDENIEALKDSINPASRISKGNDPNFEIRDGNLYVKGVDFPVPASLQKYIEEAVSNDEHVGHLVNFFKQLALNPDTTVRDQLFGFLQNNGHPITSKGYFIAYKSVAYANEYENSFADTVVAMRKRVIIANEDPKKSFVYKKLNEEGSPLFQYILHESKELGTVCDFEDEFTLIGNLKEINDDLGAYVDEYASNVYTDHYSKRMKIQVGKSVAMPREECDTDPNRTCSSGLHVGSMAYVGDFGQSDKVILECLVSPMNVAAVPVDYNNTKMRVCEYYPVAVSTEEKSERFTEGDYAPFVDSSLEERNDALNVEKQQIKDLRKVIK